MKIKMFCGKEISPGSGIGGHFSHCDFCKNKFEEIKNETWELFLKTENLTLKNICEDIGYPVSELSRILIDYFKKIKIKNNINENLKFDTYHFTRKKIYDYIEKNDFLLEQYIQKSRIRTQQKLKKTCLEKYGVENVGQLESHKEKMRNNTGKKGESNPFTYKKFGYIEYIKGKRCMPKQLIEFKVYKNKVWKYTTENIKFIENKDKCYYTGIDLISNPNCYNEWNYATIDHKISILSGFFTKVSPEIIGGVKNLCWTSRFFNSSIKKEMTETELRLSGIIERFKLVIEELTNYL
jgi:hypothetical protein